MFSWGLRSIAFGVILLSIIPGIEYMPVDISDQKSINDLWLWFKSKSFYVHIAGLLFIIAGGILKLAGNHRKIGAIKNVINLFKAKVFLEYVSDRQQSHRITLFIHNKWSFRARNWRKTHNSLLGFNTRPWSGWLVQLIRSGHNNERKDPVVFLANVEDDDSEGIAGTCFSEQRQLPVYTDLPLINGESALADIKEYADRTFSSLEMVKWYVDQGKQMPRSIAATPIEKNGTPWGVLVLDSVSPTGISDVTFEEFSVVIQIIQGLLEETI